MFRRAVPQRLGQRQRTGNRRLLFHVIESAGRRVGDMRGVLSRKRIRKIGAERKKFRGAGIQFRLHPRDRRHSGTREFVLFCRSAFLSDLNGNPAIRRPRVLPRDISRKRPPLPVCQKIAVHLRRKEHFVALRAVRPLHSAGALFCCTADLFKRGLPKTFLRFVTFIYTA